MLVKDIMRKKVITINENESISEVARLMSDNYIGSVVVVLNKKIRGILTERDILLAMAKQQGILENFW